MTLTRPPGGRRRALARMDDAAHPLFGPHLKLRRAMTQIEALSRAEKAFRENAQHEVTRAELNPQTGKYTYRARIEREPPPTFGVWIGEIAHNLRSALDGLVYQLALLNTPAPADNTQFPIFLIGRTMRRRPGKRKELIPHFESMQRGGGRSMIRNLRQEHQALIEGMQPYKRGRGGRDNALYVLKQINNADKHRLLPVVGVKPGFLSWGAWSDSVEEFGVRTTRRRMLKHGAKVLEAAADVHVQAEFMPLISFGRGVRPVEGRGVHVVLTSIADEVAAVLATFEPAFSDAHAESIAGGT